MDRTERLLDLVALLLDAQTPLPWSALRETFAEDYGRGSDDAAIRKFERDKAELLELGIPLVYRQGGEEERDGYTIDRDAYYLPEAGLTAEELAVLYAAGSAALASGAFPGRQDLAHALRKIGFYSGAEVTGPRLRLEPFAPAADPAGLPKGAVAGSGAIAATLESLWEAIRSRKTVTITYRSPRSRETTERKVDAYGLALKRGIWSLVGYCHLREDLRTFHVHRVRALSVNTLKPKSVDYEIPTDFRIETAVGSQPWEHRFHAPVTVQLSLSGELAALAERLFPGSQVTREGNEVTLSLDATYLDGLARYALSLGADCRVRSPEDARGRWRRMAERVAAQHPLMIASEA